MMLTRQPFQDLVATIGGQRHALAGATIAGSAALGCALGEACVRISAERLGDPAERTEAESLAGCLAAYRDALLRLVDLDGAALLAFERERDAGRETEEQDRLCSMPLEMAASAGRAAHELQGFRPLVRDVGDDLEMAIALLTGAAHAASLLLDSNLRIWPTPSLLAKYEPELAQLREALAGLNPVGSVR